MRIYHEQKYIENSKALFLKLLICGNKGQYYNSESVCVYFIKFYKNISLQFTIHAVDCQPCFVANIVITNQYKYWHNLRISLTLHHSTNVSPAPCCSITSCWGLELLSLAGASCPAAGPRSGSRHRNWLSCPETWEQMKILFGYSIIK